MKKIDTLFLSILALFLASCSQYGMESGIKFVDGDKDHQYFVDENLNAVVIPGQVVDIVEDDEFIFVLRMVAESIDCYNSKGDATIITHYSDIKEYWIINQKMDKVEGPFDDGTFKSIVEEKGSSGINLEIPKNYRVNTEYFENQKLKCSRVQ